MPGALIIIFVVAVAIPVAVMLSGTVVAAALGWGLTSDAEDNATSDELIDLNV